MARSDTLPSGAYCARCGSAFKSGHHYRFDPLLNFTAVCRRPCTLMPYVQGSKPEDVEGRILTRSLAAAV